MTSTSTAYQTLVGNLARTQKTAANEPVNKHETAWYQAHIGSITSAQAFVKDYRVYSYAMKAWGLGDMIYARGFITKLLTQGTTSPTALANKMTDPRYKAFAKAFDFAGKGAAATKAASAKTETVNRYIEQSIEDTAAKDNEGVRLALYFRRQAPNVTSALGILADKSLLKVIQTTFGISPSTSQQNIDKQAGTINSLVKVADFRDPKKLDHLIARFTAMWDATQSQTGADSTAVSPTSAGISVDLMQTLQGLRPGGF